MLANYKSETFFAVTHHKLCTNVHFTEAGSILTVGTCV